MQIIQPNHIRIRNMNTNSISYATIEEFDSIKNLLSEDSVYEHVYISPNKIVYRTELFKRCI